MFDTRAKDYLGKEADSLERARHASDEGLKHLHETIAKQWRRLAEGAAGSHADTSTSSNEVRNANSVRHYSGSPTEHPACTSCRDSARVASVVLVW